MKRVITVLAVFLLLIVPLMVTAESPDAGGDYTTALSVQTGTSYNGSLDKFDPNNTDLMDYWKFPVTWGSMVNIDFAFRFDAPGNNRFYVQLYSPTPADNGSKKLLSSFNADRDEGKGTLEWFTGIDETENRAEDYKDGIFNIIFRGDIDGLYVNYTFTINVTGQPELTTDSPRGYAIEITDSQDISGHLGYWDSKDTYMIIVPARNQIDLEIKNTGSSSLNAININVFWNGTAIAKNQQKNTGTAFTHKENGPAIFAVEIMALSGTDYHLPAVYNLKIEIVGDEPPPEPPDPNATIDTDKDGMDDEWETLYFGNLSQDGTQDPDEDGYTNLQEYENNTNPTNANDHPVEPDDDDTDEIPLLYVLIALAAIILIIIVVVVVLLMWTKAQERKLDEEEEEKKGRKKKRKKKTKLGQKKKKGTEKGKGKRRGFGKGKQFDDDDDWKQVGSRRKRKRGTSDEGEKWGDDDEEEEEEEEEWEFKPRKDKKKDRPGRKGGRRGGRKRGRGRRGEPPPPQEGVNVRPKRGRTPKRCGECGAPTEKGDMFCAECGYRF
jgi:hypothetical protein